MHDDRKKQRATYLGSLPMLFKKQLKVTKSTKAIYKFKANDEFLLKYA